MTSSPSKPTPPATTGTHAHTNADGSAATSANTDADTTASSVSPEAGIDRDPQSGQARNDRSLTDDAVDHLPDGAVGSTHKPATKN